MTKDTASIRDQIGKNPEITFYLNADYKEDVGIEELSTILSTKTLGHAWIVGSSTNGIVGTNTGTEDGEQQTVGGGGRVETIQRIVNPNNTFKEHFNDTTFRDSTQPNTAQWDTTNYRLYLSDNTDKNKKDSVVSTSKSIFLNSQTVLKATVYAKQHIWGNDVVKYFLSADGGSNWEECTFNVEHKFTNTGTDLRFKIVMIGSGGVDTYIEDLRISYSI